MKDKHIIDVLDNSPILNLSESELGEIQVHVRECVSCREAYEAAKLSAIVLQSRAQATIEPSPFFQTRVMAAWRERQAEESVPAMWRLWSSAKALVSSSSKTKSTRADEVPVSTRRSSAARAAAKVSIFARSTRLAPLRAV